MGRNFPNKDKDLYDMIEAMHVWEPLKKEDCLKKDKGRVASLEEERRKNSSYLL